MVGEGVPNSLFPFPASPFTFLPLYLVPLAELLYLGLMPCRQHGIYPGPDEFSYSKWMSETDPATDLGVFSGHLSYITFLPEYKMLHELPGCTALLSSSKYEATSVSQLYSFSSLSLFAPPVPPLLFSAPLRHVYPLSSLLLSLSAAPRPSLHLTYRPPSSRPVLLCVCQQMTEQKLMLSAQ